jgi:phosphoenolpyruvate synthase/pyruvate phosphate dikinase
MTLHAPVTTRLVYDFADGSREIRALVGGKGAGIAEMTRVLGADVVPAGFTITTEACVAYMDAGASGRADSRRRSTRRSPASRRGPGSGSETSTTHSSSPSAAARGTRCPA